MVGAKVRIATPKGYEPLAEVTKAAQRIAAKTGGKITITGRIVVAPDGKSRTVHATGTNGKGKTFKTVAVYDKA